MIQVRYQLLAVGLALLAGCSAYRDPAISVMEMRSERTTAEAREINIALHLVNPNSEPLRLLDFEYDVFAGGTKVYTGLHSAEATLASNGMRELLIPAVVPLNPPAGADAEGVATYSVQGTLKYVTPGELAQILLDIGVRRPRAPFKGQAQLTAVQ